MSTTLASIRESMAAQARTGVAAGNERWSWGQGLVALHALFGLTPERLRQRIGWSGYSRERQRALGDEVALVERFHSQYGDTRAGSMLEVFEKVLGKSVQQIRETMTSTHPGAELFANSLYHIVLDEYPTPDYAEESISRAGRARDFRPQHRMRLAETGDLPLVAEAGPYTEIDITSATDLVVQVVKHGGFFAATEEAMRADPRVISDAVRKLTRAARRTHAKEVWNLWVSNVVYQPDGIVWHHASHANVTTAALDAAAVVAAIKLLASQMAPGGVERLAVPITPGTIHVVCPVDLLDAAYEVNSAVDSPLRGFFGSEHQRIHVNSLLADANDWGVYFGASTLPSIETAYLDTEEPQLTVADQKNAGELFRQDRMLFKIAHIYKPVLIEYRASVKSVVA